MKYLNTREAFLNSVNETFDNEITFGGSLLGRLVNSIIRKASIEVNYNKVGSIAKAIEDELNGLISNGLSEEAKAEIKKLLAPLLLEKIYEIVESDDDDKAKIAQLLGDGDDKGLLNAVIKTVNEYPEGTKLGKGDKNTLLTKLEEFKTLLEELKSKIGDLTDEEMSDLEDEVINNTSTEEEQVDNTKEADVVENDDKEETEPKALNEKLVMETSELLQSIVNIHNYIHNIKVEVKEKPKDLVKHEAQPDLDNHSNETPEAAQPEKEIEPAAQPEKLDLSTGVQAPVNVKKEGLLNFWNFYSLMNEEYTSARSAAYFRRQKEEKLKKRGNTQLAVKPEETVATPEEKPINIEKSDLWGRIVKAYKKSGIEENIPMITNLLQKSKEGSKLENKWIETIGKQIITNTKTIGQHPKQPVLTESWDVVGKTDITNDIPKKISLLANAILPFKDNSKAIEQLGEPGEYITTFLKSYNEIESASNEIGGETKDTSNDKLANLLIEYLHDAPKVKSDYGNYTIGEYDEEEIKKNPSKILDKLIEDWTNQKDSDDKTNEIEKLKEVSRKSKENTEIEQQEPTEIKTEDEEETNTINGVPLRKPGDPIRSSEGFNILSFNKFLLLKEADEISTQDDTEETQEQPQAQTEPSNKLATIEDEEELE